MFAKSIILLVFTTMLYYSSAKPDKGRIVGGYLIDIRSRPFQVALYINGGFCGGSIISSTKILTAAHCVVDGSTVTSPQNIYVYVGSSSLNSGGYYYRVSKVSVHPSYSTSTNNYDVAVLTLSSPLQYTTQIQAILLANARPLPGSNSIVSGWGSTYEDGKVVSSLRAVNVPIVSQSICASQYGTSSITNFMICAGLTNGGKDSCQGDSGGPLTVNGQLVGVVSFGYGCARPGYAGVYASVPELRNWILVQ